MFKYFSVVICHIIFFKQCATCNLLEVRVQADMALALSPGPLLLLLLEGLVCQIKFLNGWDLGNEFCTQCHYDNFLGMPTATQVCWRSQELLPSLVSGFQVVLVVSIAHCSGSPDGASCCWTA